LQEPLISVIVPIYNVEKYLNRCIDSIINQTHRNLEIILVDDGSPDNCPKICDEYAKKDNRIIVIHKKNGGLSSARNAGLDICNGEYVSFIDSDDFISNCFIEILLRVLVENKSDISECKFLKFKENEEQILLDTINEYKNVLTDTSSIFDSRQMQLKLFDFDCVNHVVVWNKIYKKDIYKGLRFPNGKIHEDEYTTYKAFSNAKTVAIINKELYFYRYVNTSIMGRKFNEKRLDILEAYEEKKEFYRDDNEILKLVVLKYQYLLKKCFFDTKRYIKDNKDICSNISKKLKSNIKDYKLFETSKKRLAFEMFFAYFSNLYYYIARIKDRLNYKFWSSSLFL